MIYIHVPFCGSFCTYCDFYSEICRSSKAFNEYADAVLSEISDRQKELSKNMSAQDAVNTLYIGGGTPSVLPLDVLARIVKAIASPGTLRRLVSIVEPQARRPTVGISEKIPVSAVAGPVSPVTEPLPSVTEPVSPVTEPLSSVTEPVEVTAPFEEFTIEVNPEDIVEKGHEYVRGLIALGVNRISMGVQSFDDGVLRWMNRRHDARRAVEAFRILRGCGVRNISIDLIFGLSQLTDKIWKDTLEKALELAPEHISAYQLSIEEGSALAKMVADGRYVEATDEQCRRQYDILCQTLKRAGYHHYEISNFAKPGFEAVHNSAYWRRVPYIGLGPGAHSLTGNVRSWNSQELPHRITDKHPHKATYNNRSNLPPENLLCAQTGNSGMNPSKTPLSDYQDGGLTTYSRSSETLSPEDIRVERLMLSLRTDKGLEATELYSLADRTVIGSLLSEGALEASGTRIRIPEDRFFTSDEILRELI